MIAAREPPALLPLLALLAFLTIPGALVFVLLGRREVLASRIARAFTAWFVGECAAVFAVYGVAVVLSPHTQGVLGKASLLVLVSASAALVEALRRRRRRLRRGSLSGLPRPLPPRVFSMARAGRLAFFAAAAMFCAALYRPQLDQSSGAIYRTPIYWDFNVHAPIVQSFAFGDNFPAENESFAGVPETYHFFFDLLTAIPVSFGLDLASSFFLVSAASLFAVLGLLVGFGEELCGSAAAGMFAALFACTSSSLHAVSLFVADRADGRSFARILRAALTAHPYIGSFAKGNPFAYNGTMFNVFYFIEERQLVFASGFLLAAVLLLSTRGRWRATTCAAAGAFFGAFVFWHLFVTVTLGLAVVWLFAFAPDRRKTAAVLAGMALVGVGFLLWVRGVVRPEWFLAGGRPALRINPGFSTTPGGPAFSLSGAAGYWGYAWGLKAVLGLAGLAAAWRSRKGLFHALASVVVPTFLLVNGLQIVPLSVYDNHKWLRPMSLFLDLAAAFFLTERVVRGRLPAPLRVLAAAAAVVLLTASGSIELVPYLTSRATVLYARYPTELTSDVRDHTAPRSVFATFEANAIHLAGRKLFVGNDADERGTVSLLASAGFDVGRRQRVVLDLYAAPTREAFCLAAKEHGIDWLEVEPDIHRPSGADGRAPGFATTAPSGRPLRFLDVRGFCAGPGPGIGNR